MHSPLVRNPQALKVTPPTNRFKRFLMVSIRNQRFKSRRDAFLNSRNPLTGRAGPYGPRTPGNTASFQSNSPLLRKLLHSKALQVTPPTNRCKWFLMVIILNQRFKSRWDASLNFRNPLTGRTRPNGAGASGNNSRIIRVCDWNSYMKTKTHLHALLTVCRRLMWRRTAFNHF
ncbi:hypothetical protein CDAR_107261 [Caerostris darwini]|uniref:Uncharacterized protein n=1 Tax=Caerostris darwini TaxID=1538125 RepID=A0AAV4VNI6_9ARAC|nr:hypothetical protein CDAR_107261 [Caerostris darwini]